MDVFTPVFSDALQYTVMPLKVFRRVRGIIFTGGEAEVGGPVVTGGLYR